MYTIPDCHNGISPDREYVQVPQQMMNIDPAQPQMAPPLDQVQAAPLPTLPVNQNASQVQRPRSVNTKFQNMAGVNVHIHNLKSVPWLRPFKVLF